MVVVHAFPEKTETGMGLHLSFWFGTVRPEDAASDEREQSKHPVICWCGGRRVQIGEDTIACYHLAEWPGDNDLHEWESWNDEQ
jgi:hypothetical protein